MHTQENTIYQSGHCLKVLENEETYFGRHIVVSLNCFLVCADKKHLLEKHFLLSRNKRCF